MKIDVEGFDYDDSEAPSSVLVKKTVLVRQVPRSSDGYFAGMEEHIGWATDPHHTAAPLGTVHVTQDHQEVYSLYSAVVPENSSETVVIVAAVGVGRVWVELEECKNWEAVEVSPPDLFRSGW